MKKIKILTAALLMLLSTGAMAQSGEAEFRPHWYIGLQGGAQYTVGEAKFGDLLSPNIQVGVGYQFNPWLGLRLAANAWQSKGGWNAYHPTPHIARRSHNI